jgi:hypothetical protein
LSVHSTVNAPLQPTNHITSYKTHKIGSTVPYMYANNWLQLNSTEEYQVTIKNNFRAVENIQDNGDINRALDTIRENINISAKEGIGRCESKHLKPWFYEECSKLVDRTKHTRLQWLQDPSEMNEDNLSNVRWEASRHSRNKKNTYLKDEIN